jgi:hypothetical protein
MITSMLDTLLQTLRHPTSSEEDIKEAARAFFGTLSTATPQQVEDALEELATFLNAADVFRAGYAALIIGTVLEYGYDFTSVSQPLIERLSQILKACKTFAERCHSILVDRGTEEQDTADAFDEVREEVAAILPTEAQAWNALDLFWPPGIALFSISVHDRKASQALRSLTQPFVDYHEGAYWLDMMFSTPIDEPLLVIEPESQQGFQGTMTGIVDNFQLHTLLMDIFPSKGLLPHRRIPQHIVDVATGKGPQQTDDAVTGVWNMYAWTALRSELQLPDPADQESSNHWIWGEGHPQDIPTFEGHRVILLGTPSYERSWTSQRMFAQLPAEIILAKVLQENEVIAWLKKMAAALAS